MTSNELSLTLLEELCSQQKALYDLTVAHHALLEAVEKELPNLAFQKCLASAARTPEAQTLIEKIRVTEGLLHEIRGGLHNLT
jgi:hypothetical protein